MKSLPMAHTRSSFNPNIKVSVVSIALHAHEFETLIELLNKQSFQDFEFVGEAGGSIPEAWNRAIQRAKGDIIVLTETDARPVNKYWLEELIDAIPDKKTIVKGLEVSNFSWDLTNLAAHRSAFEGVSFDESFKWAEDTELFCRLKQRGYTFQEIDKAPVIHLKKHASKRYMRRAFRYGLYWSRLRHRYVDPVELASVSTAGKTLIASLLNLMGLVLGYIIYWPERRFRKKGKNQT